MADANPDEFAVDEVAAAAGIEWKYSDARQIVYQALEDGDIPLEYAETIGAEEAHAILTLELGMEGIPFDKAFKDHLRDAAELIAAAGDRARDDEAAYTQFVANHPPKSHDHRGLPRWAGSDAERLMKEDMAAGLHKGVKPKQFYATRPEFQVYPLQIFRGHIDQEIRLQNYNNYLVLKEEELQAKRAKLKMRAIKKAHADAERKRKAKEKKEEDERKAEAKLQRQKAKDAEAERKAAAKLQRQAAKEEKERVKAAAKAERERKKVEREKQAAEKAAAKLQKQAAKEEKARVKAAAKAEREKKKAEREKKKAAASSKRRGEGD